MTITKINFKSIKGKKHFAEAFAKGKKHSTPKIFISMRLAQASEQFEATVEYAVVVGKKTSKSAVMRNRIKRLLREALKRQIPEDLSKDSGIFIKTIILNWRAAPKHAKLIGLKEVEEELNYLLRKVLKTQNSKK